MGEHALRVDSGGRASFPVRFEGGEEGGVWVLPGDRGITAALPGVKFRRDDMLGAPVLIGTAASPTDGELVVENRTGKAVDIAVLVFASTGRRLSVEATPTTAAPGDLVTVVVELGEAIPGKTACATVSQDGSVVSTLALHLVGPGRWEASFRPEAPGVYSLHAWVGGDRPRTAEAKFVLVNES